MALKDKFILKNNRKEIADIINNIYKAEDISYMRTHDTKR